MKKHPIFIIILIASLAVALAFCGTVLAYMFRQTEYIDNEFVPADVSCKVIEKFDGTQKTSIQVRNTGNIDVFLRLRIISYWEDTDGNIVAKPSSMPEININAGWIMGTNNTYYYTKPVSPAAQTGSLLSSPITLDTDEDGNMQVIEIFAEAIQSKPEDAVTNSWGVTIDSNSYIITP